VPGLSLVSLQKGAARGEKTAFGGSLADWTDDLTDFSETAALIANLDLVISVDTSVAHCAGATGARLWMLDRFDSEWRWGMDATQPGWYRSLRIFRQPSLGDWGPVIDALARAIADPG
jgi:ADP-heptose:LPS heptosyltransferase